MPPRQFRPRGAGEPFRYATPRDDEPGEEPPPDEDQGDEDQGDEHEEAGPDDDEPGGREPGRVAVAGAGIATDGAGIVLALVAYPLLVNLLRGGPSQMWGWVKAKFLNQTSALGAGAQVNAPPPPKTRPPSSLPPPGNRTAPTPTTTRTVTTT